MQGGGPVGDLLLRVQSQLTDRDYTLLWWLADHGVLTSFQIAQALFPSLDYAQQRLRILTRLGVVDRFRPNKPDGGSHPYHYVLAQLGVEVVAAQRGEDLPRRDQAKRRRWHLTNRANLPHLLGTNGFFTALAGHARTHPRSRLDRWWSEAQCAAPGALAPGLISPIRPDGHGIWTETGDDGKQRTVAFFLEYDTGAEAHHVLAAKLTRYASHVARGGPAWPVLFVLPAREREEQFQKNLQRAYPAVATATMERLCVSGPARAVWTIPASGVSMKRCNWRCD